MIRRGFFGEELSAASTRGRRGWRRRHHRCWVPGRPSPAAKGLLLAVGTTVGTLGCQIPSPGTLGRQIPNVRTFGRQIPKVRTLGCQIPATAPTTFIPRTPELDQGGLLTHVWHLGEQKKRAQSVGAWGASTRSRNQKLRNGQKKKKKIQKKKKRNI